MLRERGKTGVSPWRCWTVHAPKLFLAGFHASVRECHFAHSTTTLSSQRGGHHDIAKHQGHLCTRYRRHKLS